MRDRVNEELCLYFSQKLQYIMFVNKNMVAHIYIGFAKFTHILVEEAVEGCGEEPLQAGQQARAEGPEGEIDDTGLVDTYTVKTIKQIVFFFSQFDMSPFCNLGFFSFFLNSAQSARDRI